MRGRGSLAREYTITYRDHLESNETGRRRHASGRAGADARRRGAARSLDRARASTSASASTSATRCGSTCSGRTSRRASRASARSSGRTRGTAASCSSSGPVRSTRRRTPASAILRRRRTPTARARFQRDLVARLSQRVGDRRARDDGDDPERRSTTSPSAISIVGGVALTSGVLILDRRGRDDEVPARLRGGDPAHARREHAAARRRRWRSSTARWACSPAWSARSARSP